MAVLLHGAAVQAVVDEACRAEWLAVLDYPALALSGEARGQAQAAFDRCTVLLAPAALASRDGVKLPRCGDPDPLCCTLRRVVAAATAQSSE